MHPLEDRTVVKFSRRAGMRNAAAVLGGSRLLRAQQDTFRDHSRIPAMDELVTAFDFEPVARARLSLDAYQNTALGAEGEFTLRRNREVFDWVELVPRAIVNAASIQTATDVLGTRVAFPIMIAPTSGQGLLHRDGEMAMHQAATAASNTPMLISFNASFPLDKIAAAATGPLWYQLYPRQTPDENRQIVEHVQELGCRAIVVTVDAPVGELRERALHMRNLAPPRPATARRQQSPDPNQRYGALNRQRPWIDWKLLDSFRKSIKVPLICKAILTAEDALECVEHGWDGIIVSNHGGRSNDYVPSTLEVLPEIVDALQGRLTVMIDGGFRRGSDVLKALALGAKAVCMGRAPRYGLAAYGPAGAQRVLEIVQGELVIAMAANGCPTLESIDRSLVKTDFS